MRSTIRAFVGLVSVLAAAPNVLALAGTGSRQGPGPWVGPGGTTVVDRHILVKTERGVALTEGQTTSGWNSTGVAEIDALNASYGVVAVYRVHVDPPKGHRNPALFESLGLDRIYYFEFAAPRPDLLPVSGSYQALGTIEKSWQDGIVSAQNTPNDPLFGSQWNYAPEDVNCELGWDRETRSDVLVAVVDSGAEYSHLDLDDNLWKNPGEIPNNHYDDDGNGYVDDVMGWDFWNGDDDPDDDFGHGTHVAGIIGAEGDNGLDIAGICWTATIQVVKVLHADGTGSWLTFSQGITYAADNGAVVSNYSFGGNGGDPGTDSAVQYAAGLDIVQVAAAGNNMNSTPFYPAAYDNVIAVMASDYYEKRAVWSNYGPWCDLCAPGDGITSLWTLNRTTALSGTSQSAPHVSAIAALVRTLNPQLDRIDTELVIEHSAKDLGTPGRDSTYEWGLADLEHALAKAVTLSLSATSAGRAVPVDVFLNRADAANDVYLLLPGISDRLPGLDLSTIIPGDYRTMPLNMDIISSASLNLPFIGVFNDFVGYLDSSGKATATFVNPGGRIFQGTTMTFSGLIFPVTDLSRVSHVLSSIQLELQ